MKGSFAAGRTLIALVMIMLLAPPAQADPPKCRRTILRDSGKFAQAKMKALTRCEAAKIRGKLPPATVCLTEPSTAAAITNAETKMRVAIGKSCGGADRTCGIGGGDDSPASVGWPSTCPDFEQAGCTNAITHCGHIADCLFCINEQAIDQARALYYDALVPSLSDKQLRLCQIAIGKATAAFFAAKTRALGKCWDARFNAKHSSQCPSPGDGKAAAKIAKAEAKKRAAIIKACGGLDRALGGGDDFTPAQIGFVANCPNVTVPGGPACGGLITDLDSLIDCVDCVTEFKVDCAVDLAVPTLEPYPPECNVGLGIVLQRGDDGWVTPESAGSFDDFSGSPIPGGFFDPNSDPFAGTLMLRGSPLHTQPLNALGPFDTIVRRPVDSAPIADGGPAVSIPLEIVALSLVSAQPITITYNGGMNPELWHVKAALSTVAQTPGSMSVTQSGPDGGTYTSTLPVLPKFIFTRQSDQAVRTLDCGGGGCGGPIVLQSTGSFWALVGGPGAYDPLQNGIQSLPAGVHVDGDANGTDELTTIGSSNFRPGVKIQSPPECVLTVEQTLLAQHGAFPGCTDHYKLYAATGGDGPIVDLEDEFGTQNGVDLGSVEFFLNPVKKQCPASGCDTAIIGHPHAHLTAYTNTGSFSQTVEVLDQFGQTLLSVGNPRFVAVPSEKAIGALPGTPDDLPIDHYKCYDATGPALNKIADLTDQFGLQTVTLQAPVFFCNPVVKSGEDIVNPKWHLTCYGFTPTPFNQVVNVRNQFGTDVVTIGQPQALCVPSRRPPSQCGGRKCLGGVNNGLPCDTNAECPGGNCLTSGAPSAPNACIDDSLIPGDGTLCVPDPNPPGLNEGVCPEGPQGQHCGPTETFRDCTVHADCPFPGDTCSVFALRECFGNGNIGNTVTASGQPDVPVAHQFDPRLASLFCVPPTTSSAANTAAGLPGLGRLELVGHATDDGTGGSCPTMFTFEGTSTDGILDVGWTGLWHDKPIVSDAVVTYQVTDCANPVPPCGVCDYTGPIANAAGIDSQRCSCDPDISCTNDLGCPGNCACVFYAGSYLPIGGGGVSACVGTYFQGDASGTVNFDTGAIDGAAPLVSEVYLGVSMSAPCPVCTGDFLPNDGSPTGLCSGGLHPGGLCDANGSSPFGSTSLDCPPLTLARIARSPINLSSTTGTVTTTLTSDSPYCAGAPSLKCFCGACDNAASDPCGVDSQCGQ